ncbi:MAG TPA: DUF1365 family protein [Kiritimatiellia bacterium]|nr:DUF1365 family protein [Kiritimatiellia bacterium]
MNSRIIHGWVMHARIEPRNHAFRYPACWFVLDLDELPRLAQTLRFFGYNRKRPWAIHDRDFFEGRPGSIREHALRHLADHGVHTPHRIELITCARYFNYVFNPVSFYLAYDDQNCVIAALAEVNNTFGERTLYPLTHPLPPRPGFAARFQIPKNFHVSPFNDLTGDYLFDFSPTHTEIDIHVDIQKHDRIVFTSRWHGPTRPLTDKNLLRSIAIYPITAMLTVARIHWQAAILYFRKKQPFYSKPVPESPTILRTNPPTRLQRWAMNLLLSRLDRLDQGHLTLTLPDHTTRTLGTPGATPAADLTIRDPRFFTRVLFDGDIGLGESFSAGEWTSTNPTHLLTYLIANRDRVNSGEFATALLARLFDRARHLLRPNSRANSRRNIQAHYDLSNDFFKLILDPTLMYSCALFNHPGESLEQAQINKLHRIIRKARIASHHHVLEIGSGWGSFAIEAVRLTGCRVTSITLSQEQLDLARQRAREEGLDDRITFQLIDYRNLTGQFDRIVSIEMLEAVGHRYLPDYFRACENLLAPDGLALLQVITIPDQRYHAYRTSVDWIQKYIFPGGHLPSLGALSQAIAENSNFIIEDLDNIGPHYAPTLARWRDALLANAGPIKALGFDDTFLRTWNYYFTYCEAAFATRTLSTLHLLLTRPHNPALITHDAAQTHTPLSPAPDPDPALVI